MILVIDSNPLIAGFLRNSTSRKIILYEKVVLHSPDWLISEFERNESELMSKFPNSDNFFETKNLLFKFVKLAPESEYLKYIKEASKLAKHIKDISYFALALYLKCPIWSDEKSFKLQSKVEVYSNSDLVKELGL